MNMSFIEKNKEVLIILAAILLVVLFVPIDVARESYAGVTYLPFLESKCSAGLITSIYSTNGNPPYCGVKPGESATICTGAGYNKLSKNCAGTSTTTTTPSTTTSTANYGNCLEHDAISMTLGPVFKYREPSFPINVQPAGTIIWDRVWRNGIDLGSKQDGTVMTMSYGDQIKIEYAYNDDLFNTASQSFTVPCTAAFSTASLAKSSEYQLVAKTPNSCSDSDSSSSKALLNPQLGPAYGNDPSIYTQGAITLITTSKLSLLDHCEDSKTLLEWFCSGNNYGVVRVKCDCLHPAGQGASCKSTSTTSSTVYSQPTTNTASNPTVTVIPVAQQSTTIFSRIISWFSKLFGGR
jgi:hypothetical protein